MGRVLQSIFRSKNQVDHRSYERQGIDYIATIHEGYTARLIEKRGGIAERCEINREIVKKNNLLRTLRQQLREVNEKITELIGEKGKQANERISRLLNRAGRTAHQRARNSHQSERGTIAGDNKPTGTTFEERLSKLRSARTSGTLEKKACGLEEQIQKLKQEMSENLSANSMLMSKLQQKSETIKSLNDEIGRFQESDKVLRRI